MADRRNRVRFRGRSPSPRCPPPPRPRDFSPSRHRKYSPHDRSGRDEYPRRIEKRDHHSRYGYNNRDRRYRSPARIRNPRRIESRDEFDRDNNNNNNNTSRNVILPDHKDPDKGKYKDGVSLTRPYDEGLYRDGSSLKKFQLDHHFSDGPRESDCFAGPTRDYNGFGYLGSGRDGLSSVSQYSDRTKSVYLKYEREENTSSHSFTFRRGGMGDMPLGRNISSADGISHVSPVVSRYLKTDTEKLGLHDLEKKKDAFGYQDDGLLGFGKRNEDNFVSSQGYFPSSQPRDYVPAFSGYNSVTRDHNMSQRGSGLDFQPPVFDGIKEKTGDQFYTGLHEEKKGDALFGGMRTRLNDIEEDYRDRHLPRNDLFNSAVNEGIRKESTWGDGHWGPYSISQVQPMPDKLDMLGIGSSRLNSGYGGVKNEDNLQSGGYHPDLGRFYDVSPRKTSSGLVDFSLDEPFDKRLGTKHDRDDMLYDHNAGIRISADGNGARTIYNRPSLGNETDFPNFSKRPKLNYEETWRGLGDRANDRPTLRFHQSRPDSRDIKKRLGPAPRKLHVSQRLVDKYKPSVMKRLAPAPSYKRAALPWIKNIRSNESVSVQDSDGSAACDCDDQISLVKTEPPEKSEDFKQLVQSAFFKFLKNINETPAKRNKYTEQVESGSLKCVVCGSNSDEFADTESLARHAFASQKFGLRSQHLGLHRALCALMGWKIMEQLGSEWRCEVISDAEASALKEDLIIWPPVVIVCNTTINNKNHDDEQVIVSTEKLDMKLRDMGFRSIVKVCNGKPGNQSVMLVKFNGTLSGLGEAERYHNRYAESNHGRANLKLLKSDLKGKMLTVSDEREEEFLYGHLGIAEDLDNLDFDTKKRCVLRSKNEILSIVNAP